MIKRGAIALVVGVFILSLLTGLRSGTAQEQTTHESKLIAFAAERSLAHLVRLWKDKRFDALYKLGTFASQVDISPEGFERQMGFATRTLQCCWQTIQDIESTVESPRRVYVKARLGFKTKEFLVLQEQHRTIARGFAEEETLTFLLQFERQQWRLDLFRLLALSGIPLEVHTHPWLLR